MDTAIEQIVKSGQSCEENLSAPAKARLHLWEWPECAGSCEHVDYAARLQGQMFLILVDAYSKWIEVVPV